MERNEVLFDDWQMRCEGVLSRRRVAYTVCIIITSILASSSFVGLFFEPALIVPLILSVIALASVVIEWQKIKNNHLIIRSNQIEITNRFNKTSIYKISIHELTLSLEHSFNRRSGGIIMKFYDTKDNLICKYEDMLNRAAPFGFEKTTWERSIEGLDIKMVDSSGIIKN